MLAIYFGYILLIAFRGASFPVGVGSAWAGVTASMHIATTARALDTRT